MPGGILKNGKTLRSFPSNTLLSKKMLALCRKTL
jgi:hypothetical protein